MLHCQLEYVHKLHVETVRFQQCCMDIAEDASVLNDLSLLSIRFIDKSCIRSYFLITTA